MIQNKKIYDLEERTAKFAEEIIIFLKTLGQDSISSPIINQLVRSATSIGANYCEANGASSKKDFANKIYTCKKESKETMYWLRLLSKINTNTETDCEVLWQEAKELTMIFSKIVFSIKN